MKTGWIIIGAWCWAFGVITAANYNLAHPQAQPSIIYYPEAIDSLWTGTHPHVAVAGFVAAVGLESSLAHPGQQVLSFRIGDQHGHYKNCIIPPGSQMGQPKVGVEVIVSGIAVKRPIVPFGQGVVEIDPVEKIEPVE